METTLLQQLFQVYGPLGLLSGIGFVLYYLEQKKVTLERKRNEELAQKLYEVSLAGIQADIEHSKSYEPMERFFDSMLKAMTESKTNG